MAAAENDLHIIILDESELLVDLRRTTFRPANFGGTIPQEGDLIAGPSGSEEFDHELPENQRMREVVERYFWPSIDPKVPTRVCLLVRERGPRKSPKKRAVTNTKAIAKASTASDIPFIIQQIYTCLKAAKECRDTEVADALQRLADAFADRAISLGADPKTIPRTGSQKGSP